MEIILVQINGHTCPLVMHDSVASLLHIITGRLIHSDSLSGMCSDAECQRFHNASCISGLSCFFVFGIKFLFLF